MGNIIDDKTNDATRCCRNVKLAVVWISLIGSSVTLLFLIFCIIKMIKKYNQITTLTTLILLIFFGEVVLCISKLSQMIKYVLDNDEIICQIQIFFAIYADYCSLVSTFLLSLKCYDILKYKNKYFRRGKRIKTKIIISTILFCLLMGVIFLIINLIISNGNYDSRDDCSYWCWLDHNVSLGCYSLYFIFLIVNIILFVKIRRFLNRKHKELSVENEQMMINNSKNESKDNIEGINIELQSNNSANYSNQGSICLKSVKIKKSITAEERANNFKLIKIKCKIYPLVTIIFWVFAASYRLFDNFKQISPSSENQEKIYLDEHTNLELLDHIFLAIHTFFCKYKGSFLWIFFHGL